jgi:hypothetical protein
MVTLASSWLALLIAATGVAAPSGPLPVRLAPVTCPGFPDADVRAALQVELRDRLIPETAPSPPDFALVSVACAGSDADLLIVRQATGTPVRRRVPLGEVVPDARPRAVAIAVAELLRVDLARNAPPPPPEPPPPLPSGMAVAISGAPVCLGGYLSGRSRYEFNAFQLRFAFESWVAPIPGQRWGWGFALGLDSTSLGGVDVASIAGAASALVRWRWKEFTWELGAGARLGHAWDYRVNPSPPSDNFLGPFASLAVDGVVYERAFSRVAFEGGFDSGPLGGSWIRLILAAGFRF